MAKDDQTRRRFQEWFCYSIGATVRGRGADGGYDGTIYLECEGTNISGSSAEIHTCFVEIKSGRPNKKDLDQLVSACTRERAKMGILCCLYEPTYQTKKDAEKHGRIIIRGISYPKYQIITAKEILSGIGPVLPDRKSTIKEIIEIFNTKEDLLEF